MTPADDSVRLANAILRCAQQHSPVTPRLRGDHVDFAAWWRGGDSLSVRLYLARATWKDVVTGASGGARDFARVLGLSLRELLDRYGFPSDGPPPPPTPAPEVSPWSADDAEETWRRHAYVGGYAEFLRKWIRNKRGLQFLPPSQLLLAEQRFFPEHSRAWVRGVISRSGSAALVPMRRVCGPRAGRVDGLVLRPLQPPKDAHKSLSVRGLRTSSDCPCAFGLVSLRGRPAEVLVLVEGAPDTWTAELLLQSLSGPPVVVAGANGAGMLPGLARALAPLRKWRRVLVVAQRDKVGAQQSHSAAEILGGRVLMPPYGEKDLNAVAQHRGWAAVMQWGTVAMEER